MIAAQMEGGLFGAMGVRSTAQGVEGSRVDIFPWISRAEFEQHAAHADADDGADLEQLEPDGVGPRLTPCSAFQGHSAHPPRLRRCRGSGRASLAPSHSWRASPQPAHLSSSGSPLPQQLNFSSSFSRRPTPPSANSSSSAERPPVRNSTRRRPPASAGAASSSSNSTRARLCRLDQRTRPLSLSPTHLPALSSHRSRHSLPRRRPSTHQAGVGQDRLTWAAARG